MPTDPTPTSATEWEVEEEDFTPEGPLKDGQEIIDGEFIIDKNGIKRRPNGHPLPGIGIRPAGKKAKSFREFKYSMLIAFHANGGTAWLTEWGARNPALFFKMMSKMIPQALNVEGQKAAVEVNISWATDQRLSYQNEPQVVDAAPSQPWKEPAPNAETAVQVRRLVDDAKSNGGAT